MRITSAVAGAATAAALVALSAAPAAAGEVTEATGEVVVFSTEVQPLDRFPVDDSTGCTKLPVATHVLSNLSDVPITVYGDPFCMSPSLTVEPGHGTHAPPMTGSFAPAP